MWLLLLHLALAKPALAAEGPVVPVVIDTSTGPVSSAEARLLWKRAESDYRGGRFRDAIYPLKRILDRYPGYPDPASYRQARFQLGNSYVQIGQYADAIAPLRAYIEGKAQQGTGPDQSNEAKILLGQAEIGLGRYDEAYLDGVSLENAPSLSVQARALLLRAQALMGKGKDERAASAAESAKNLAGKAHSTEITEQALVVQLELKTRECGRHPASGKMPIKMDEAQVREELDYRGTCLNEALARFHESLDGTRSAKVADRALSIMKGAFSDFTRSCENPPDPPPLKPDESQAGLPNRQKDRTPSQLREYRKELAQSLEQACGEQTRTAREIIDGWKKQRPTAAEFVLRRLKSLEESLR